MNVNKANDLVLLGVGGGGCQLAAAIAEKYGEGLQVLGVDTDAVTTCFLAESGKLGVLVGGNRLAGRGTGGDAVMGRLVIQDDFNSLKKQLQGARTAVLVTCLGGGTGSGATPEIAKELKDMGIVTLGFVFLPFSFEGQARQEMAQRFLPVLEDSLDSVVTLPLDALFEDSGYAEITAAIPAVQEVLTAGVTLLWRAVTTPGFIQLTSEHLRRLVGCGGRAKLGYATAGGEARVETLLAQLKSCRLLSQSEALKGAGTLLVGILGGADLRLAEVGALVKGLKLSTGAKTAFEVGTVLDPNLDGRIELVVLAFEQLVGGLGQEATEYAAEGETAVEGVLERLTGTVHTRRKTHGKGGRLAAGATGRGRFRDVPPTKIDGQDFDIPTFVRRGIVLER